MNKLVFTAMILLLSLGYTIITGNYWFVFTAIMINYILSRLDK